MLARTSTHDVQYVITWCTVATVIPHPHPTLLHHVYCVTCSTGYGSRGLTILKVHRCAPPVFSLWTLQTPWSLLFVLGFVNWINVTSPNPKSLVTFFLSSLMIWLTIFTSLLDTQCSHRQLHIGKGCAPFLANLFLYSYEFKYMDRVCKENYNLATKLSFSCRYIDDLITLNNVGIFDNKRGCIYPRSLK